MVLPSVVLVQVSLMSVLAYLCVSCPSLHIDPLNIFLIRYFLLSWVGNGSHRWRYLTCSWFRWVRSFLGVFSGDWHLISFLLSFPGTHSERGWSGSVLSKNGKSWYLSCPFLVFLCVFTQSDSVLWVKGFSLSFWQIDIIMEASPSILILIQVSLHLSLGILLLFTLTVLDIS